MTKATFVDIVESVGGTVLYEQELVGRNLYPAVLVTMPNGAMQRRVTPTHAAAFRILLPWVTQQSREEE